MKKICLVFVLSIVSVFSVSAQTPARTNLKSADDSEALKDAKLKTGETAAAEDVKAEPAGTKTEPEPFKTTGQTSETVIPAEKKPEASEEKKPEAAEPVKKLELPEEKKPAVSETVKKPGSEEQKTRIGETEKKPEASILTVKKISLGTLSTGNAAVDGYIEEFSELFDVDPLLIYAQMSQESSFKARATSAKGASGFMQLMPGTARRFGVTNIYNPKQNIRAGVKYMRWLLDKFGGDLRLALAGYNAGEGSVIKYGNKIPPYRETQNYVAKIMNHYELITNQNSTLAQIEPPTIK